MKLVQCSVAPSLVVEWLCGELEERGIPGPTYAHTLLSLLHHHYCPHPPLSKSKPTSSTPSATPQGYPGPLPQRYHHPLSRKHLDDFDLRDLDLDDLLASTTHPDADIPSTDIQSFTQQQRGSSRRARKRYKVRQKQRTLTSEQLQKVAALQCLMSASDERYDLECLVEELCSRLKSAKEEQQHCSADHKNNKNIDSATVGGGVWPRGSEESQTNDTTDDSTDSSTPEEQAQKYYAAFPPLSGSHVENCEPWKPDSAACSRALISKKVNASLKVGSEIIKHSASDCKMPRSHRKKLREREKKKVQDDGNEAEGGSTRRSQHHVTFTFLGKNKEVKKLSTEHYDTDSASDIETGKDRRRKKFTGPLPDEDIGEGYIGDTSSRESSEDRDKGEGDLFCGFAKDDKCQRSYGMLRGIGIVGSSKASPEEWECMGSLLMYGGNDQLLEANVAGQYGGSGHRGNSRLFERGSSSSSSGSSSDVEIPVTGDVDAESVRQLERKISHTMAAWGQAADDIGHGRGEHVWDPPTMNDLNLYTSIWGYDVPEGLQQQHQQQYVTGGESYEQQEPSIVNNHSGFTTQDSLSSLTPTTAGEPPPSLWPQHSDPWQSSLNPLINEDEDPLISSFHSHSPLNSSNNNLGISEIILNQADGIEKAIWSDCNANNISGQGDSMISFIEDLENANDEIFKQDNVMSKSNEHLENKLCESFKKLDLDDLWDSSLGLANTFASDLSISNSNLECVGDNNNVIDDSKRSDSQHEQMMALVEDVCKSYEESQEEILSDTQMLKQVASGPRGPHADLRHNEESSGFTVVVPRTPKHNSGLEELSENLLLGATADTSDMDAADPLQEEENLLTSPRTHFRPIRQESLGSTADEHYEDGTMFVINSDPPDLPFQRTGSGALFLESDLLQGSPKKYMVYKEPVAKPVQNEDKDEDDDNEKNEAGSFIPKFKVVNNEKFCQTEDERSKRLHQLYSESCREKLTSSYEPNDAQEEFLVLNSNEEESDVFDFQHQDFPEPSHNLANIWKTNEDSDDNSSDIMYSKNIWQMQLNHQDKVWSVLLENSGREGPSRGYELVGSAVGSREDVTTGSGWSCEAQFEPLQEERSSVIGDLSHNKSEAVSIPTSLANLWDTEVGHSGNPLSSPMFGNSISSLKGLWSHFPAGDQEQETKQEKAVESSQISHQQQPPVGSQLSGIIPDSCFVFSNLKEPGPWKSSSMSESFPTGLKKENLWPDPEILEAPGRLFGGSSSERCVGGSSLRAEADKEAEELLGALSAQTNTSAAPQLYGNSLPSHGNPHPAPINLLSSAAASTHGNSLPLGRSPLTSPRPLHERLSKAVRGGGSTTGASSGGGGGGGSGGGRGGGVGEARGVNGEAIEQEDLDDLAPGWELNDGFEWEPQTSLDKDDEDGCADEGEGCEVLIYEADDGSTYTIPVEYLDDTLYDQIFGDSAATRPFGGSLPDLPLGNPLHMRFSSELEEEWKKSGIPYKVQLPRKSRPGKWIPPSRRPCSFFMEGNCRRTDCKFSHDLASITCRFWEEGSCLKGITCPFLHGYPLRRRRNKSEGAAAAVSHTDIEKEDKLGSSFEINSEMDFPSLGSSAESKVSTMEEHLGSGGGGSKAVSQGGSAASVTVVNSVAATSLQLNTQKNKKKKKFITITKNLIGEIKSIESDRAARRKAVKIKERRRRNTDTNSDTVNQKHPVAQTSSSQTKSNGLKKGECQRTHGNGHDDGTMSDY
ncbi:unnamed protein product [Meganyctiphanes norvegica]|uniref:C3H1-type domain-containing protein n=1 Tax=Meganyctiphanes norvegica TaxID=48144 RepID=A0AAV2QSD2_MEGNR